MSGLAETLGLKVFVKWEKKVILECLESPEIISVLTSDPHSAGLHVLPMGKLNLNVSLALLNIVIYEYNVRRGSSS